MFWAIVIFWTTVLSYLSVAFGNIVEVFEKSKVYSEEKVKDSVTINGSLLEIMRCLYRLNYTFLIITNFWPIGVFLWAMDVLTSLSTVEFELLFDEYIITEEFEEVLPKKEPTPTWVYVVATLIKHIPFLLTLLLRLILL